ncbi:MAG: YgiT-type zinc finger protein [Bdellovibrionaceae bacterium]|nr:YgiT-type zinc finger protein [Pseudobdellovibrionaceae bacterium]
MKCAMCDNPKKLKKTRISKWYKESGLDNIYLKGVIEYRCDKCGETYHSYGDMDQLHRLIASTLICKKGRLTGAEVRFLRKALAYNSTMFAKLIGIKTETLSRLENAPKTELKNEALDHSIRFLVASRKAMPDRNYDIHDQLINDSGQELKEIHMAHRSSGWRADIGSGHEACL